MIRVLLFLLFLLPACGVAKVVENIFSPENSAFEYVGRFDFSNPREPSFDWTGVYIQTQFEGTSCKAILSGKCRYDIFIDNKFTHTITVEDKKETITLADKLQKTTHTLRIAKRTETNQHVCTFYGLILDSKSQLVTTSQKNSRKIEFIGDSYTAGFGNEHTSRECTPDQCDSILFMTTNTNKAFGPLLGKSFNAQYQVIAYSGRGLVRNYNGMDKGKEFLYFYDKVLNSDVQKNNSTKLWDFSKWHPDVVVIGLGINDFLADPPYGDSTLFDSTYCAFLDFLRKKHPGVKLICCATDVWPTHALIPRVKSIVEKQKQEQNNDVWYFEYASRNTALYGHPSVDDHKMIAKELQPLIAQVSNWNYEAIK